jgi:hypothetical protein
MSLDLASENNVYQDMAIKFFEHFLYIAEAIHNPAGTSDDTTLWDEDDAFYYDVLRKDDGSAKRLKIRSMVGIIPLFAVETLKEETYEKLPEFRERLEFFEKVRPKLHDMVSRWEELGKGNRRLFSLLRGHRMKKIFERILDPNEFLSDYGVRALSKYHKDHPYEFKYEKEILQVSYNPGESDTHMFGGNSNWRGPIWFPVNYLLIESLWKFDFYYDDDFQIEYPTGSGKKVSISKLSKELSGRLISIFTKGADGKRPVFGDQKKLQEDPHFKDYILFYEYFHGDNGRGLGASHQTGWTALVADLIHKMHY